MGKTNQPDAETPIIGGVYAVREDPDGEKSICVSVCSPGRGLFMTFSSGLIERRVNDMVELELVHDPSRSTGGPALTRLANKLATLEAEVRKLKNKK